MRPERGAGDVPLGIEDVFAMLPRWQTVVDDQRQNDVAGVAFAVSDILSPASAPLSIATDAAAGVAPIAAIVTATSAGLISAMVRRGATHSGRKR